MNTRESIAPPWLTSRRGRVVAVVSAAIVGAALLPAVPIVAGVLLLVSVALHAASADLRPYLEPFLRLPIAAPRVRRARRWVLGAMGVALVSVGAAGATVRGRLITAHEQREARLEAADRAAGQLIEGARRELRTGTYERAELLLLGLERIEDLPEARRAEAAERRRRIRS